MNRITRKWQASALLFALATSAVSTAAYATEPPVVSADSKTLASQRYEEALTSFHAGKLDQALPIFQEAWSLNKNYQVASALGVCELELGKHRAAAEHLYYAVKNFPEEASTEERSAVQEVFEAAAAKVVQLTLQVMPEAKTLTVNNEPVQPSVPAFYEPGELTIKVSAAGYTNAQETRTFPAGTKKTISFTLAKAAPPEPLTVSTMDAESSSGPDARLVAGVAFAYGACGGLGLGIAGSASEEDHHNLQTIGFATAGALGAVSAGLLIWLAVDDTDNTETAFVTPLIGKEQLGLILAGTWQ